MHQDLFALQCPQRIPNGVDRKCGSVEATDEVGCRELYQLDLWGVQREPSELGVDTDNLGLGAKPNQLGQRRICVRVNLAQR